MVCCSRLCSVAVLVQGGTGLGVFFWEGVEIAMSSCFRVWCFFGRVVERRSFLAGVFRLDWILVMVLVFGMLIFLVFGF